MATSEAIDSPDPAADSSSTGRRVVRAGAAFGLAVTALGVLQATIGAFDPRPVVFVLIALAVTLAGLCTQRLGARRALRLSIAARETELRRLLGVWPPEELPNVDSLRLGVFPARRDLDPNGPYVGRAIDEPLRAALASNTVALVFGPARAGKSRTALEAVLAACPGARILAPRGPKALVDLLNLDPPVDLGNDVETVVWLDGLERYAGALDALALDGLAQMTRGSTVVITVRTGDWEQLLAAGGEAGETARAVAARARAFELPAALEPAERARAEQLYPGSDFGANVGLGAALAAGGTDAGAPPRRVVAAAQERDPLVAGRRDPELVAPLVGAVAALAAFALVWVFAGFSTPAPPSIGDQVSAIKNDGARGGRRALEFVADLHGSGDNSYTFVFQDIAGKATRPRSDQIRVYDTHGTKLVEELRFEPAAGPRAVFQYRASRDVDSDGEDEIVGGYGYATDGGQELVPFAISWSDEADRYRLVSLDVPRPALSRPPASQYVAAYTKPVTFTDPLTGASISGDRVQDFGVSQRPDRLVAGYFIADNGAGRGTPYELHPLAFDSNHDGPHLTPCQLFGHPTIVTRVATGRTPDLAMMESWAHKSRGLACIPVPVTTPAPAPGPGPGPATP